MANQYVNKVVVNGQTKIDLTADTVAAANLLAGITAHDRSGAPIEGTMPSLADATDDATANISSRNGRGLRHCALCASAKRPVLCDSVWRI